MESEGEDQREIKLNSLRADDTHVDKKSAKYVVYKMLQELEKLLL